MQTLFRFAATCAVLAFTGPALASTCTPQREPVTLQLADFSSAAEIVTPPAGMPARGVLLLFGGSDVADMDSAIEASGGGDVIVSRPLRQVADSLACAGFASLRYNKRYVSGPTTVDRTKFDALNGSDLAADGRTALRYLHAQPRLGTLPIALLGWSEGTTVALAVAATDPAVRALVLLAPVVDPSARVAQAQYQRVGKPYLMGYARQGALDADAIARADAGPGGILAHIFVRMFRGFRPGERVNPLLDTDKDGRISFAEADPIIAAWYADGPGSGLGMSSTERALKGLGEAYAPGTPPVLILQGLEDSMIGPAAAQAFSARSDARGRVRLMAYPGLGHSLGRARSALEDGLLPVADQPLADMAGWLKRTLHK